MTSTALDVIDWTITTTRTDADPAAIRAVIHDVAAGVTAKDADRCAAWFSADARSVTATGARALRRDAIRAAHQVPRSPGRWP